MKRIIPRAALAVVALGLTVSACAVRSVAPPAATPPVIVDTQPTAAPAQPTAAPAEEYPAEPRQVVEAFLAAFGGSAATPDDPQRYLSRGLLAQIRPDYPLNLILGVQNMYSGFEVTAVAGPEPSGVATVSASLSYTIPALRTFALVQEDGRWRIDRIAEGVAAPTPAPVGDVQGVIYYVDRSGTTIQQINADGSGQQVALTSMGGPIDHLDATPDGRTLIIGSAGRYATFHGDILAEAGAFVRPPRPSPDGTRLVGQALADDVTRGPIVIVNLLDGESTTLPVAGVPDWLPDGQSIVYAGLGESGSLGSNVFRYDLASGAVTQLTSLTSVEGDVWYIQEAHALPDRQTVVFYGNHTSAAGAGGNSLQWWSVPLSGGEARLWSEGAGQGVSDYGVSADGALLAYSSQARVNACLSAGDLVIRDTSAASSPRIATRPPLPQLQGQGYAAVQGLSWSPEGAQIAFAIAPRACQESGPVESPAEVYTWSVGYNSPARKLADGAHPVWLPAPLPAA